MFNIKTRNESRTAIESACISLASDDLDYTLDQIVDLIHAQGHQSAVATADAIVMNGEPFPMDGSVWNEAGHQYSAWKQWWPLPDRI